MAVICFEQGDVGACSLRMGALAAPVVCGVGDGLARQDTTVTSIFRSVSFNSDEADSGNWL
jgi:hypothetical protein